MAFQPFGYLFQIRANMPPADAKAAIRGKKRGWFDPIHGPRGWIIGPFLCLWSSAFDRYGPMLFGLIRRDNRGTRITGRAGSDLNGIIMLAVLMPALLYLLSKIVEEGQATVRLFITFGVLIPLGLLSFWWAHKDRKKADHLVRFIRQAVGEASSERPVARRAIRGGGPPAKLGVGDRASAESPTAEHIYEALDQLTEGLSSFLILERDDNSYMQSTIHNDRFVVEVRDGAKETHRHAVSPTNRNARTLGKAQAAEALLLYLEGREAEAPVVWESGYANV